MTEFQELIKDAPKFDSMERGELVAYAYAIYAAGAKADAENAKLRKQLIDLKCAPCCGDSCWLHLPERLRELGVEVDG